MSFFGIALEDMERAKEENILMRGVNAVEKGNYLCILTGGGFRLYDKNDYSLVLKENGMSYIYDCEFSDDLTMLAIKSWSGYAIFYDLVNLEKIKRISLLNKKKQLDNSADCGCSFGESKNEFYDIVHSDDLFVSVLNKYNTKTFQMEDTFFENKNFMLKDIGYSARKKKFWLLGYEHLQYRRMNGKGVFKKSSERFILWTSDFINYDRYDVEEGRFVFSLRYDEDEDLFLAYDPQNGNKLYHSTGELVHL